MDFQSLINKHQGFYPFKNYNEEFTYYNLELFEQLMEDSPNVVPVEVLGREIEVLPMDNKYGTEQGDDKQILCRYDDVIPMGSVIVIGDNKWIVVNEENLFEKTHRSYRMMMCNGTIKFTTTQGRIVETNAIINNKIFYTEGIDRYQQLIAPDGLMNATVPKTEETKALSRNIRIIMDGQVFVTTYIDKTTQKGLINVTLSEVNIREDDDLDNKIADSIFADGIIGKDDIEVDLPQKYHVDDKVSEWKIVGDCATILKSTENSATINGTSAGVFEVIAVGETATYKKQIRSRISNFD